ncbi:MAG: DUF378 domain-containing protein [Oscillospiraceae bacterium]|jgi:uncharacterized membrane protein YuzA (DUF378 family)|nr:DUF378 domain-containing protein [Oscillospiraceae bacterium]
MVLDRIALVIVIIGALCLGSIGIFGLDFIARLFGGAAASAARVVYTLVGFAGIWCISLLFREHDYTAEYDGSRRHTD